jgi:uncharacterized repeat protein (TIGR02543 family)
MTALKDVEEAGKWNTTPGDYKKIPMWGRIDQLVIDGSTESQSLTMYRMLARIDVDCRQIVLDNKFDLTGVYLYNYNTKGRVAPAFGNLTGSSNSWTFTAPTQPTSPSPTGATELAFTGTDLISDIESSDKGTKCRAAIYTFESLLPQASTNPQSLTCLVIGGKYRNAANPTYYRVDFRNDAGYFSLLRGHRYFVSVTDVKGPGMPTPDDAFNSVPVNITASVLDWRTDNANITGIASDGQKYLGVNQGTFPLDGEAHTTAETNINLLEVITDVTDGWYLEKIADADGEETNASWLTLWTTDGGTQIAKGNKGGDANTQTTVMLKAPQNLTAADRTAYVHLKAGRITYKVKVEQEIGPLEFHFWIDPVGGTGGSPSVDSKGTYYRTAIAQTQTLTYPSYNYTIDYNVNGGESTTPVSQLSPRTISSWDVTGDTPDGATVSGYNLNIPSKTTGDLICTPTWGSATAITLPAAPTYGGWTFNGWYTASTEGSKAGNAGASYTPDQTRTLYAQWTAQTHTYAISGGGTDFSPSSATNYTTAPSSQEKTINAGSQPTYTVTFDENYTGGWNSTANSTQTFNSWTVSRSTGGGTLPSVASTSDPSTTLTIPANSYGNITCQATWNTRTTVSLPSTNPTRTGYTFAGWYTTQETGGTQYTGTFTPSSSFTLYARWTANTYNYWILPNGGTGGAPLNTSPGTYTYQSSSQNKTITAPTKSVTVTFNANGGSVTPTSQQGNLTISSWTCTGGASVAGTTLTIPAGATGDITLTPNWGTYECPSPSASAPEGWTFDGWATSTGIAPDVTLPGPVSGDITYYLSCYKETPVATGGQTFPDGSTGSKTVSVNVSTTFSDSSRPSFGAAIGTWSCGSSSGTCYFITSLGTYWAYELGSIKKSCTDGTPDGHQAYLYYSQGWSWNLSLTLQCSTSNIKTYK